MGTLCTRKDRRRWSRIRVVGRLQEYVNALVAQELSAGSTMLPTAPVMPEQGLRTDLEGMQEHADAARCCRATDTVRGVGRCDSDEDEPHRPTASCHEPRGAPLWHEESVLLDNAESHQAAAQSPAHKSDRV